MRTTFALLRLAGLLLTLANLAACGDSFLTGAPDPNQSLDGPLEGLSPSQSGLHARGDSEFARRFTPLDGVGPLFVATSCESCHVGDGKGHPLFDITRFGRPSSGGFDPMTEYGGPQLQSRAIPGYPAEELPTTATAIARFTAPSVTGLGFLEAVDDSTILALADENDANGDGISGRVSLVAASEMVEQLARGRAPSVGNAHIGRFGKKARAINLEHQTITAYLQDMGLTTDLMSHDLLNPHLGDRVGDGVADPEVGSAVVSAVSFYLRTLRAPPRRDASASNVREGEQLFVQIGCNNCHRPQLRTGRSDLVQLDRVEFAPFTDLLLHDMGVELNDGYTEGNALPSEWRTAPLWGIGLAERAQGGTPHYLHDGRAKTLRDAIRYHGGEAARSRTAFDQLSMTLQERVLTYLRSL